MNFIYNFSFSIHNDWSSSITTRVIQWWIHSLHLSSIKGWTSFIISNFHLLFYGLRPMCFHLWVFFQLWYWKDLLGGIKSIFESMGKGYWLHILETLFIYWKVKFVATKETKFRKPHTHTHQTNERKKWWNWLPTKVAINWSIYM